MSPRFYALALVAVLLLSACGDEKGGAPNAVSALPPPPITENLLGKSTYGKVCALCHAANIAGAPKPGDVADWGPRIAQGKAVLYQHALEGFTGKKGAMPVRGGNPALTDEEIKAAIDYMVSLSQ